MQESGEKRALSASSDAVLAAMDRMKETDFAPGIFSNAKTLALLQVFDSSLLSGFVPAASLFATLLTEMENSKLVWKGNPGVGIMERCADHVWPVEREYPWVKGFYAARCRCVSCRSDVYSPCHS